MRALVLLLSLMGPAAVWAVGAPDAVRASAVGSDAGTSSERGWTVHVDNDLFAFADNDRDYTGGVAFTLGGAAATDHALSLSSALGWINEKARIGARRGSSRTEGRALEIGIEVFTPQDLEARHALVDDRPYANLIYASSSVLEHDPSRRVAYQSSLTVGLLGLSAVERLHRVAHRAFGSAEPMGYAHQISDGGEPTFRYAVSRYKLLAEGSYIGRPYSLRFGADASLGYLTEAGAELAFRWGRTRRAWWSSLPASSDYAGHPPIAAADALPGGEGPEVLLDAGVKLKARFFNSFLQGQLRDSAVTYSSSELNRLLLEAWVGVTTTFGRNLSVSYTIRHQTEEIRSGDGARSFTWASIGVAQRF